MTSPGTDEWSLLAEAYEDVPLPRFVPLYETMAKYAIEYLQNKTRSKEHCKVLDFGTGPGEPILTLLKQCMANKINQVDLIATDPSPKMVALAEERLKKIHGQELSVRFSSIDDSSTRGPYDIILSSLVVIYAPDQAQMLRDFHRQLREHGLLISSHWAHPSLVPFLTIVKRIAKFMATGKRTQLEEFETDASFSLWSEEQTRKLFTEQGFTIQHWDTVNLPMAFPNIRTFLSFCRVANWFNDPNECAKAEAEVQKILREDLHTELQPDGSFAIPSKAVVVVASK